MTLARYPHLPPPTHTHKEQDAYQSVTVEHIRTLEGGVWGTYVSISGIIFPSLVEKSLPCSVPQSRQTDEEAEARKGHETLDLCKVMRKWQHRTLNPILLLPFEEQPLQCFCSGAVVGTHQSGYSSHPEELAQPCCNKRWDLEKDRRERKVDL